jgi:hypothetical protein
MLKYTSNDIIYFHFTNHKQDQIGFCFRFLKIISFLNIDSDFLQ